MHHKLRCVGPRVLVLRSIATDPQIPKELTESITHLLEYTEDMSRDENRGGIESAAADHLIKIGSLPSHVVERLSAFQRRPSLEREIVAVAASGVLGVEDVLSLGRSGADTSNIERAGREMGNQAVTYPDGGGLGEFVQRHNETVSRLSPFDAATWAFFNTIVEHPLTDGNGRLSRALFQVVLISKGTMAWPILPLGPLINLDRVT